MSETDRAVAEELFFRGTHCMQAGDASGAEACFRQAIAIMPDFGEAYANLGMLLEEKHDTQTAEACYHRSIELSPAYPQSHLNLGALFANQKRFLEAELAYLHALALQPEAPAGWSNLGVLYACQKRETEAEQYYRTALSLNDAYRPARFNLSYLLLRQGRFEEGWACLDARNWQSGLERLMTCPPWQGETLAGKSILIGYEAGHGDMIQFCRYATLLKAQGASSITLVCHPGLKTLFSSLRGVDMVIGLNEAIPTTDLDYWTPLLSVPRYCNTRLDSIPAEIPYLHVPATLVEKWATLLPAGKLRVGLVWKGNSLFENDKDRSLPSLSLLASLAIVQGVDFISLQKGNGEDEALAPPADMHLTHLGTQLTDFADTAAVIMNLDLVICVDTAVAHLAGALGKPCWVMLPYYKTDWRWMEGRNDSPWYPGVIRLFRQTAMSDWDPVIAEVLAALKQWAAQPPNSKS